MVEVTDAPPVRAIPSDRAWFDPRLLTAAVRVVQTDVPCAMNANTLVARPAPTRLLLVVTQVGPIIATGNLAPWPDADQSFVTQFGFTTTAARFTLFEWPGLVQVGWYFNPVSNITVRVTEVLRNG